MKINDDELAVIKELFFPSLKNDNETLLKAINNDFNIDYMNSSSSSFEGLSSLESIGGDFIATPYNTTTIYIKVENHLSHLTTVGGNMEIRIETYDYSSQETFDANHSDRISFPFALFPGCCTWPSTGH